MHPRSPSLEALDPCVQQIPLSPHHPVTASMATPHTERHAYPTPQGTEPTYHDSIGHATWGVASQTSRAKHSGLGVMPRPHMQVANQGRFCSQSVGFFFFPLSSSFTSLGLRRAPSRFWGCRICLGIFEACLSLRAVYALSWLPIFCDRKHKGYGARFKGVWEQVGHGCGVLQMT